MTKSVEIVVSGKVQGVWFRATTKRKADQLNVVGSVQNIKDGSVRITAKGEEVSINEFIQFCKIGPDTARVKSIVIRYIDVDAKSFEIIR